MQEFDLLVLGGGPGGYVAALRAAQLGLKVCLIEKEALGGVCLNKGCIPSKALLTAAELYTKIKKAGEWGIELSCEPVWNTKKLLDKKNEVVQTMRRGLETLCQKRKVQLVKGEGRFISPHEIEAGGEVYKGKRIVIATGSRPRPMDFGIADRSLVFSSAEALALTHLPRRLMILGGGPEGVEFALIYAALGSHVVLVEAKDRLLPGFDRDASAAIRRVLSAKNIEIAVEDRAAKVEKDGSGLTVTLEKAGPAQVDSVLVSVGRVPNSESLGLDKAGVRVNAKGFIETDAKLSTSAGHIYAIGDVTGNWMMAHAASYEGYMTAERAAGMKHALDYSAVPSCVYSYPEVAEVGMNEEKASAHNIEYQAGRFSFMALGRSHAKGETEGFVKILGDAKNDRVIGGVVVGQGASELINVLTLAIKHKLTVADLRSHISPHPSASEAVVEAAHLFFKEGLHYA